jgi:hypothetical protein
MWSHFGSLFGGGGIDGMMSKSTAMSMFGFKSKEIDDAVADGSLRILGFKNNKGCAPFLYDSHHQFPPQFLTW